MGYRVRQPWSTTALALGFPLPRPWPAIVLTLGLPKKGPCVQGQGSRSPDRVQGLKFPRVPGAEGSRSPKTLGSKGSSYQGSKDSKGPRVQGSRGLMVQGSRGTRGSTRTHEVPASRGPKDPRDWVFRTKDPKTQGSTGQGSAGQGPSDNQPCIRANGQAHDLFLKKFVCQPVAQRETESNRIK